MPSRRDYLAGIGGGLGSVFGLSGCLRRSGFEAPEPLSFGEEATVGDVTVTPRRAHPQASFFHIANVDWGAIEQLDSEWVVFVSVSVRAESGARPASESFRLVAADEKFAPREQVGDAPLYNIYPDDRMAHNAYPPDSGEIG
ncbi:hypothetical protein E6P09_05175 [Haloferax mediterranei ATCC 33500]|uniref:Uncharacterized protein n=1 Tax=Haloferax mediterranei (strain ATCC 33500 / DSM 1411 / JCM 8866 / NBRC 14739 / NCIMB 2177 / R-4) TaxID=523841 RepID=I3R1P7_HALMT|nr:hypothetical protein [Haloferax mediterranei]AFK18157.1 hypothetical protein HFX_0421 [Haloferax mediterranei ATCC 33500]AHZ22435.1 hypothetical protein BM92_07155 [Haloferax mediterranei ATCC 33500]EMA02570.1 hypothetical protein C439_08305 [Haloferax mediterranei ATCC 33500]MDX5988247.1 hypothetical protein [Haloferax mediterranei ATCC 33500]QCQ74689.1 hypothetical protein E6P09_05175 [Haloferax mediterranei ATCC 33500]